MVCDDDRRARDPCKLREENTVLFEHLKFFPGPFRDIKVLQIVDDDKLGVFAGDLGISHDLTHDPFS